MTDEIAITLELTITDRELCTELRSYPKGVERNDFAINAMRIGALALRQAQGRIDAELVRAEGNQLMQNMAQELSVHQDKMTQKISSTLKDYFDPESGRFDQRVQRLISKDGELERLLRGQIGVDGSELARTLTAHVGKDSLLMQTLSPDANSGIINSLTKTTEQTLSDQRKQILNEFSLDNPDGALSRLVKELTKNNNDIIGEFSLDREDSALSRLISQVERAQQQISNEFSLDDEGSALARMRQQLMDVFDVQSKENRDFQAEVREKLTEMTARRGESRRSTRHGLEFEEAVFDFINERCQKAGNVAIRTSNTAGSISRSRVGDVVVEMGPEHVAAGTRIVAEAKEDKSYTLSKARQELDTARKNRDAQIGLFVMSKSAVPEGWEPFGRYGNDIIVVWDTDDPISDVVFDAGLSVATALCVRIKAQNDEAGADFEAIAAAILAIEQHIKTLDDIDNAARLIQDRSSDIRKNAQKMSDILSSQVAVLNDKVSYLRHIVRDTGEVVAFAA